MDGRGDRIRTCVHRFKAGCLRPLDYTPSELGPWCERRKSNPGLPVKGRQLSSLVIGIVGSTPIVIAVHAVKSIHCAGSSA